MKPHQAIHAACRFEEMIDNNEIPESIFDRDIDELTEMIEISKTIFSDIDFLNATDIAASFLIKAIHWYKYSKRHEKETDKQRIEKRQLKHERDELQEYKINMLTRLNSLTEDIQNSS